MARLNVLEYKADFLRGWPHGSAVEMNYPSDVDFGNGDIVEISADGKVVAATDNAAAPAIIARGRKDTFEAGGTGRNNLYTQVVPNICLFSNFIVRTSTVNATGLVAGAAVGVVGGVWDAAATTPVGTVLEVETNVPDADGNVQAAVAVILVK